MITRQTRALGRSHPQRLWGRLLARGSFTVLLQGLEEHCPMNGTPTVPPCPLPRLSSVTQSHRDVLGPRTSGASLLRALARDTASGSKAEGDSPAWPGGCSLSTWERVRDQLGATGRRAAPRHPVLRILLSILPPTFLPFRTKCMSVGCGQGQGRVTGPDIPGWQRAGGARGLLDHRSWEGGCPHRSAA